VIAFIKGGLRDLAIFPPQTRIGASPFPAIRTRSSTSVRRLHHYLSATGWPTSPKWDDIWPADVHMVGKEIYTRFHATLWPAMLMALGLERPATSSAMAGG